jgi:hypothetical protein
MNDVLRLVVVNLLLFQIPVEERVAMVVTQWLLRTLAFSEEKEPVQISLHGRIWGKITWPLLQFTLFFLLLGFLVSQI